MVSGAGELVSNFAEQLAPVSFGEFWNDTAFLLTPVLDAASEAGATILDPASTMCIDAQCPLLDPAGWPALKDCDHYRPAYVEAYAGFLDKTAGVDETLVHLPSVYCV